MLHGRVKTLHPAVHGGILARLNLPEGAADLEKQGIQPIDLVVCNLYPFEACLRAQNAKPDVEPLQRRDALVEEVDIGGVTLLRAAAKNHARVTVLVDPADYDTVITEIRASFAAHGRVALSDATRQRLAVKAFETTARYDDAISAFFGAEYAPT
ncbi:methylglyoxal synthase-like protein, partial [Caulochytrium protostelioides]